MSNIKPKILLIEDDRNARNGIAKILRLKYDITVAEDGIRGINILKKNDFDIVITDIKMPGADGMAVLKETLKKNTPPLCIIITAYGSIETAVEAMKEGAYHFISKPINLDGLELTIERALESRKLQTENKKLKKQLNLKHNISSIIGKSAKMETVIDLIRQVAPVKATVLLTGESGTGKELAAQAIHGLSERTGAFVPVHCAALSSNLLESELFGHEKGAFTGAIERKIGRFEAAHNGTIFLDEIGEIDQATQVKLLRVLETKMFERIGSTTPIETDTRIIAATNKNLEEMVKNGEFREDLYYRLNILNIELPPLRERKEDIPLLVHTFIKQAAEENNKKVEGITDEALNILTSYNWPGNIRELRNCIERMVVLCREKTLTTAKLPPSMVKDYSPELAKKYSPAGTLNIEENEKKLIIQALDESGGNRTEAAAKLGISRRTLHRKLNEYNIT
ncbi:MAG: sigma-54 dependent transcriptional regulator [Victivallales bacterium]|nr:sigma-54 dependent transcriptional regulator [Victivallales bacterium]